MSLLLFDNQTCDGCDIAVSPAAPAPERFAAEELRRYLTAATGGEFPIVKASDNAGLLVGEAARALIEAPALSEDGYLLRRVGRQVALLGGSPRATLYAAYHFLERHLGFCWPEPGDDVIPSPSRIIVGDIDEVEEPVYTFRSALSFPFTVERGIREIDWLAKNRLNWAHPCLNDPHRWEDERGRELVMPEAAKRGLRMLWGGHTFQTWIPTDVYFATHPEFFGLVDGVRKPQLNDSGSLCISNADLQQEVARNILRFAADNPGIDALDVWMNDTGDWCECEECRRMEGDTDYERYPEFLRDSGKIQRSRAYFTFINNIARLVRAENPTLLLSPLAYARSIEPPDDLTLEPNVLLGFTNFLRTRNKSLLAPDNARNAAFVETIKRWQAHAENLFIYEYFSYPQTYNAFTELLTNVADMAEELRFYPSIGIRQCSSEGAGEGYWRPLVMYAYAKLVWNPALPHEAIMADFCRAYGDVAAPMLDFWRSQEAREPFLTRRDKNLIELKRIEAMTDDAEAQERIEHLETLLMMPDRITEWPS